MEWVATSFSNAWRWKEKVKSLSRVWLLVTPWSAAYQAPPSMGFSRQEYWSGSPLPSLNSLAFSLIYSPTITSIHDYWKNHSMIIGSFSSKVMSLFFNLLSTLVIVFLPRSKHLWISWLQSPSAVILEPKKIKSVTVSPSICHEVMGPDAMILAFWMLSFKPVFSLSSFTFIKRLFSSSLLSAVRVVSSAYLRLLIFLLAILIPACASSSPVFLTMYSAYKLNKQGDNIQLWRTPFPIWNQSVVPCLVFTVASWPAYRFLKRQVKCLVCPSPAEFPTVYCVPHNQRLGHSQ